MTLPDWAKTGFDVEELFYGIFIARKRWNSFPLHIEVELYQELTGATEKPHIYLQATTNYQMLQDLVDCGIWVDPFTNSVISLEDFKKNYIK